MKSSIRESILKKRILLRDEYVREKSRIIVKALLQLGEYKNSRTVMFFVSIGKEVFTHDLIRESLSRKIVVIPKVIQNSILPSLIIDFDSLIPSARFNIPEPIEVMQVAYKNIDIVLVPGIAFDKLGYRLGYGLGMYDKFLKQVPNAVKIGLAFDFQVIDEIPAEIYDIPVDYVITENRVIKSAEHSTGQLP